MEFIEITKENIDTEHICCAITDKKSSQGVLNKKQWMLARFKEGLKFIKLNVRGKVFIEYIPAEYAWRPVIAPGYMFIHCLWVSGKFQGQSYGKQLLQRCMEDAKGMKGIAVVTSKKPFLTEKSFFENNGFEQCDAADPWFELMVKKNDLSAETPKFHPNAKQISIKEKKGLAFYYTDQCPFTAFYVNEMADAGRERNLPVLIKRITNHKTAQKTFSAFGTFNVFLNGQFLTHKIESKKSFGKLLDKQAKTKEY